LSGGTQEGAAEAGGGEVQARADGTAGQSFGIFWWAGHSRRTCGCTFQHHLCIHAQPVDGVQARVDEVQTRADGIAGHLCIHAQPVDEVQERVYEVQARADGTADHLCIHAQPVDEKEAEKTANFMNKSCERIKDTLIVNLEAILKPVFTL